MVQIISGIIGEYKLSQGYRGIFDTDQLARNNKNPKKISKDHGDKYTVGKLEFNNKPRI